MEDEIKINIHLRKDTVEMINKIVQYKNLKNELIRQNHNQVNTIEDFITGCVNFYINQIVKREEFAGLDDLGKPFRLRNHFKDILKRKGWNQKHLSDLTNIDPSNISIILSNRSQPSLDYFLRIWITLGCPPLDECLSREEKIEKL